MGKSFWDANRSLFFHGLAALVAVAWLAELIAGFQVFLVAGGAMRHMLPPLITLERSQLGGASGKIEQPFSARTTFAIRVRIGRENDLLDILLDAVPFVFRRFSHVRSQNIMARFQRSAIVFSVV